MTGYLRYVLILVYIDAQPRRGQKVAGLFSREEKENGGRQE